MMNKESQYVIMTLIVKVICWGQVKNCNNCEIPGIENFDIDL